MAYRPTNYHRGVAGAGFRGYATVDPAAFTANKGAVRAAALTGRKVSAWTAGAVPSGGIPTVKCDLPCPADSPWPGKPYCCPPAGIRGVGAAMFAQTFPTKHRGLGAYVPLRQDWTYGEPHAGRFQRGMGAPYLPGIEWGYGCPPNVVGSQLPYGRPGTVFQEVHEGWDWIYDYLPDNQPQVYGRKCAVTQAAKTEITLGDTVAIRTNYPVSGPIQLVGVDVGGIPQPFWVTKHDEFVVRPTFAGPWARSAHKQDMRLTFRLTSEIIAHFQVTDFDFDHLVLVKPKPRPTDLAVPGGRRGAPSKAGLRAAAQRGPKISTASVALGSGSRGRRGVGGIG